MFTGSFVHLAGGALFTMLLAIACVTDLRSRKIPNELVLAILVSGWLFALVSSSDVWRALGMSVAGTAVGFGIWIGFYLVGVIGAGDVKFFAAAGAWLGPGPTWRAALIAAVVGGLLAVAFLLREGRLGEVLRRAAVAASSGSLVSTPEQTIVPGTKHRPLPYGVALAIGALVVAWVPRLS
jgi:prepilin peptidase CpaA